MRITVVLILILFSFIGNSQSNSCFIKIDSIEYSNKIEELREDYSFNKEIPPNYDLSVLIALSYFPELKESHIIFKEAKIKTTLNARPSFWSSIFRKRENRKYIVRINNNQKDSIVNLSDVSFNARIGLFGHEFCHFVDYNDKNFGQLMKRLVSYTNTAKKEEYEKEIDSLTIDRGLGWQLYDWSNYVLSESEASSEYKKFKSETYLKPEEIEELTIKSSD